MREAPACRRFRQGSCREALPHPHPRAAPFAHWACVVHEFNERHAAASTYRNLGACHLAWLKRQRGSELMRLSPSRRSSPGKHRFNRLMRFSIKSTTLPLNC